MIPRNNFFATKTPESLLCFLDSQCLLVIALNHERQPFHSRVRARPRSERTECRSGDSLNTHALSAYLACCQQNVFQIIETQQCPAVGLPRSSIQQHSCRHIKALKSKWHNAIKSSNILSLRIVFFLAFFEITCTLTNSSWSASLIAEINGHIVCFDLGN